MLSGMPSSRGYVTPSVPYTLASLLPVRTSYLRFTAVERFRTRGGLRGTLSRTQAGNSTPAVRQPTVPRHHPRACPTRWASPPQNLPR